MRFTLDKYTDIDLLTGIKYEYLGVLDTHTDEIYSLDNDKEIKDLVNLINLISSTSIY